MVLWLHELRKNKKSILLWSLIIAGVILLYMSFFPSMKDAGFNELLSEKINLFPEALVKSFHLDSFVDFSKYPMYFAYVFQFVLMAISIYALILGVNSLLREENEKTIEFLYANPVSRFEIVTSKLWAGITGLVFVYLSAYLFSIGIGLILGVKSFVPDVSRIFVYTFLPTLVYFALGMLLSSIMKSNHGTTISLGVFFFTYILSVMSSIVEKLKFLEYASPNQYLVPVEIIKGNIDGTKIGLLVILFIVSIVGTYIAYNKKQLYI